MSISGNCKTQTPLGFSNLLNEKNNNHPSPGRVEDKWLSVVDILIYGTNMVFLLRVFIKAAETHRLHSLQANPLDITNREKQKYVFKSLLFPGSTRNIFPPSLFSFFFFFPLPFLELKDYLMDGTIPGRSCYKIHSFLLSCPLDSHIQRLCRPKMFFNVNKII